ncbi:MAG: TRAP transporter small permease [Burkholderiaceae bacterium]
MNAALEKLSGWMAGLACICLILLMLVTFLDVVGRYFFNTPLTYSVELTEFGMGLLVCLGLAVTTFNRGHISVDLLNSVLPSRADNWFRRLTALTGVLVFSLIAWRLYDRALSFMDDGLTTQVLALPVYPVVFVMAAASVVAALIALVQLFEASHDA